MTKAFMLALFLVSAAAHAEGVIALTPGVSVFGGLTVNVNISDSDLGPAQELASCVSKLHSSLDSLKRSGFTILSVTECSQTQPEGWPRMTSGNIQFIK